jgi:multidrug efflux pump subunit AcrA (membrane-fusion protein)
MFRATRWAAVAIFVCILSIAHAVSSPSRDCITVAVPVRGRLILVGRELRDGETVLHERAIMILQDPTHVYFRLKEGDHVECGELLGRVDSEAPRTVEAKATQVKAAEAELRAAEAICEEARIRWERMLRLSRACGLSQEELEGAKFACRRYLEEANVKRAYLKVAHLELEQAKVLLQMQEIRSPVRGIIRTIRKKQGEAVDELEGIFRIEIKAN